MDLPMLLKAGLLTYSIDYCCHPVKALPYQSQEHISSTAPKNYSYKVSGLTFTIHIKVNNFNKSESFDHVIF
jgi:hypothetical protein